MHVSMHCIPRDEDDIFIHTRLFIKQPNLTPGKAFIHYRWVSTVSVTH